MTTTLGQPVLVGVGTSGSVSALAWAADRALESGGRVVAVQAVAVYPFATHPLDGWIDLAEDQDLTKRILQEQCQHVFDTRGVPWAAEIVAAPTTTALVSSAHRHSAGVLVLERPTTRWQLLRLTPVLFHVPCPVVLVGAPNMVPAVWSTGRPARSRR